MPARHDAWCEQPLNDLDKGAPGDGSIVALDEVGKRGFNILSEDLPLPVAVIRDSALHRYSSWMRAFLGLTGADLAPHGKTTMAPALFDLQREDGAWGITLSTPHQIRVARHFGHRRIFVANQIVGRAAMEYIFREISAHPDLEFYCIVDSIENIGQLQAAGLRLGAEARLNVLVEVGFAGGRTGCRTLEEAVAVANAVAAASHLRLCGVEGFEGIIWGAPAEMRTELLHNFLDLVCEVARRCEAEGLFDADTILLSAGGTAYFDVVAEKLAASGIARPAKVLIRSGCYLTHDSVVYARSFEQLAARAPMLVDKLGDMEAALEVWAYVQSRPEPTRAILGLGKRDISGDDMPVPLRWHRPLAEGDDTSVQGVVRPQPMPADHVVVALNDQHAFLNIPADSPLAVGDMVALGVSHPCLTFDKWRVLHRVDDAYHVTGSIRTYF